MPEQGIKPFAVLDLMFENDGRAVIQRVRVIIKTVNPAVKGSINRSIAIYKQINAQMNSTGLRHFIGLNLKLSGRV